MNERKDLSEVDQRASCDEFVKATSVARVGCLMIADAHWG